jgi:hypothetical protein
VCENYVQGSNVEDGAAVPIWQRKREEIVMKKVTAIVMGAVVLICCGVFEAGAVEVVSDPSGTSYTFTPTRPELLELDHDSYWTWGIEQAFTAEEVVSATLTIRNIYDWNVEDNDHLFIHLLETIAPNDHWYLDPVADAVVDAFEGEGVLLADWSDPDDGTTPMDLVIEFDEDALAAMVEYSADGYFGIGFDPDCYYYNDGIEFTVVTVVTEVVPEPASAVILGFGLVGLGFSRYRRNRKRTD